MQIMNLPEVNTPMRTNDPPFSSQCNEALMASSLQVVSKTTSVFAVNVLNSSLDLPLVSNVSLAPRDFIRFNRDFSTSS